MGREAYRLVANRCHSARALETNTHCLCPSEREDRRPRHRRACVWQRKLAMEPTSGLHVVHVSERRAADPYRSRPWPNWSRNVSPQPHLSPPVASSGPPLRAPTTAPWLSRAVVYRGPAPPLAPLSAFAPESTNSGGRYGPTALDARDAPNDAARVPGGRAGASAKPVERLWWRHVGRCGGTDTARSERV